jgi:hypothetical protein
MDHGPVVSNVYELIRAEPQPWRGQYWRRFVSAPDGDFDVSLLATPAPAELSQAEGLLLREIFALHGANTPGTMFPNLTDCGQAGLTFLRQWGADNDARAHLINASAG